MSVFEHCLEHRLKVPGRGVDDLKDFRTCALLCDCLRKFGLTLAEPALQFRHFGVTLHKPALQFRILAL